MNEKIGVLHKTLSTEEHKNTPRKAYRKPVLKKLGDLRTLTLGPSGAPADWSGGALNQKGTP